MRPAAARAALDRISHGVDFDTTPIATALNWCRRGPRARESIDKEEERGVTLGHLLGNQLRLLLSAVCEKLPSPILDS